MNLYHGCTEAGANFHFLLGIAAGVTLSILVFVAYDTWKMFFGRNQQ